MAQFSPVEWMLRRNCLILPTSCPIVPSATPKLSKPPTMKNPSFNCGSFDNVTAFLGSSSKTSQVVLINLSLGCSALPDTNLNVERRMGGWNNMKYLVSTIPQHSLISGERLTSKLKVMVSPGWGAKPQKKVSPWYALTRLWCL